MTNWQYVKHTRKTMQLGGKSQKLFSVSWQTSDTIPTVLKKKQKMSEYTTLRE
jgi:hypothetical protein